MKITTVCSSLVFTTTYIHGFPSAAKGYFFFEGGPGGVVVRIGQVHVFVVFAVSKHLLLKNSLRRRVVFGFPSGTLSLGQSLH